LKIQSLVFQKTALGSATASPPPALARTTGLCTVNKPHHRQRHVISPAVARITSFVAASRSAIITAQRRPIADGITASPRTTAAGVHGT